MKRIRNFKEEWVDNIQGKDIFRNPNQSEWAECVREQGNSVRGVIRPNGDFFCTPEIYMHDNLLVLLNKNPDIHIRYIKDWWEDSESIEHFLCVTADKYKVFTAESYDFFRDELLDYVDLLEQYKALFERKNPRFKLII